MDIRNATIYEIHENESTKEYIERQKHTYKRGGGSVLVITDKTPECEFRELQDNKELNREELFWSGLVIMEIMITSDDPEMKAGAIEMMAGKTEQGE